MEYYTSKIPKDKLIHGAYYKGSCRNASIARWNAKEEVFYHFRQKFGWRFVETICCPEDDEHYDVFVVEEMIENPKEEIPFINE